MMNLDFRCNKARAIATIYGGISHQGSPPQINMNSNQKLAINKEIKRLIAIGCIKEVKRTESLFLSNIFTVLKKNGDLRLVINLKDLNQFLAFHHFKMESFQTVKDLIQEVDWMINLDLKEAYHSVPVTPDHQIYLAFLWDGKCYVYCVLPFGLGPAPRVFTKITKPILVHILQNLVIRCVMILIFGKTKSDCLQKANKVITLLQELGFTINIKKSILEPTQQIEFLGLILDSIQMKVFLPEPKVLDLIESCQAILSMTSVIFSKSSREDEFLSPCSVSCFDLLLGNSSRHPPSNGQNQQFPQRKLNLSSGAKSEIQWWIVNVRLWNGSPVHLPSPSLIITTDATKKGGWGHHATNTKFRAGGLKRRLFST